MAQGMENHAVAFRDCLRADEDCSCVLRERDLEDGIADDGLREKFRTLLSTLEPVSLRDSELRCYLLAALVAIQGKEYGKALEYFRHYELKCFGDSLLKSRPFLYYYKALIAYGLEQYRMAAEVFSGYFRYEENARDEIAWFHLGNCFFRLQQWEQALESYGKVLAIRKDFREAMINIGLVARKFGDDGSAREMAKDSMLFHGIFTRGTLCEDPFEYTLAIPRELSVLDIPIFINSRDRLHPMRQLIDWLLRAGYRRIYVLDNDSTYSPLLEYYRQLDEHEPSVRVLRLRRNIGHTALWDSGVLEIMQIDTPYVYTDSDVVPTEDCPSDILTDLLEILRKYPFLKKAGLGLRIDDITYFDKQVTRDIEERHYRWEMEKEVYFSSVDTTFALYRNYRHYNLYVAARTTGRRMARHLPWYYDYEDLPEDEEYYMAHANRSASFVERLKSAI